MKYKINDKVIFYIGVKDRSPVITGTITEIDFHNRLYTIHVHFEDYQSAGQHTIDYLHSYGFYYSEGEYFVVVCAERDIVKLSPISFYTVEELINKLNDERTNL